MRLAGRIARAPGGVVGDYLAEKVRSGPRARRLDRDEADRHGAPFGSTVFGISIDFIEYCLVTMGDFEGFRGE